MYIYMCVYAYIYIYMYIYIYVYIVYQRVRGQHLTRAPHKFARDEGNAHIHTRPTNIRALQTYVN